MPITCSDIYILHASLFHFLQAITVLNHAGVCVSYQTAWKYIQQLTAEAGYQQAVQNGHWQWVFENLNMHQTVRHKRQGNVLVHACSMLHDCTYMKHLSWWGQTSQ